MGSLVESGLISGSEGIPQSCIACRECGEGFEYSLVFSDFGSGFRDFVLGFEKTPARLNRSSSVARVWLSMVSVST